MKLPTTLLKLYVKIRVFFFRLGKKKFSYDDIPKDILELVMELSARDATKMQRELEREYERLRKST